MRAVVVRRDLKSLSEGKKMSETKAIDLATKDAVEDPPLNKHPAAMWDRCVRKCRRSYEPTFAREAEMLTLFGAGISMLEDWFAVDVTTLEEWAREHAEFRKAMEAESLNITLTDFGLLNWFKDYCLGNL